MSRHRSREGDKKLSAALKAPKSIKAPNHSQTQEIWDNQQSTQLWPHRKTQRGSQEPKGQYKYHHDGYPYGHARALQKENHDCSTPLDKQTQAILQLEVFQKAPE